MFLNTGVLATEHYKQPEWLDDFQGVYSMLLKVRLIIFFYFTYFRLNYSLNCIGHTSVNGIQVYLHKIKDICYYYSKKTM